MNEQRNVLSALEQQYYHPDGSMREWWKAELRKEGVPDQEIAQIERDKKIQVETLQALANPEPKTAREREIERAGLTPEELLSEGHLSLEDFDESGKVPDFDDGDWTKLL